MNNTTVTVTPNTLEIFRDPEFESVLKTLATEFGENATLKTVNTAFQDNKPVPEKIINGRRYLAGYRGRLMLPEMRTKAKLIDIKETKDLVKLMFNPEGTQVFVYHNVPKNDLSVTQVVRLATTLLNNTFDFDIVIKHETIPATGDKHAIISNVFHDVFES